MYKVNYYYSNIKSFFHNDNPEETVGIIGYLRGDFASSGEEFHTTWFDVHEELKTLNFKTEIDDVIQTMAGWSGLQGLMKIYGGILIIPRSAEIFVKRRKGYIPKTDIL